ncbi:MAG: ChbG/HpnK family deacetylase, partial [bacterium]
MKRLIVNADGFGFTLGCNKGVFEAIEKGIVSSVSINVNFPPAEEAILLQERYPALSIGVHLNAIVGPPVSLPQEVQSLLDPATGEFLGGREFTRRLTMGRIDRGELARELTRQVELARRWGVRVSHIDSHQNRHLHPTYFPVFLEVGKQAGIMKMRTHSYFLLCREGISGRRRFYLRHPGRFLIHQLNRWNMARARRSGFLMADRNLAFTLLEKGA